MKYLGSKNRFGKEIAEVLQKYGPPNKYKCYLEPFCGSLSVTIHMVDEYHITISDYNKSLIMLWKELKSGSFKFPKKISEKMWLKYKNDPNPSSMKAYLGHGCSFGGCWFGGYVGTYRSNDKIKDANKQTFNSLNKRLPYIKKINKIKYCSYDQWEPKNMLIYCDPPYKDTRNGYLNKDFNHDYFWNIMRKWSKHNVVIISEFKAPKDFKCIWKKKKHVNMNKYQKNSVEKLFIKAPKS
jgi:DNA adenine methylase